jgi:hypothetical protein
MVNTCLNLTSRQWATIDGEMDNSSHLMREAAAAGGEVSEVDMPRLGSLGFDDLPKSIRQLGATQIPWVGSEKAWPPDDQSVSITLSDVQWNFITTELRKADIVYEKLGDGNSRRLLAEVLIVIESGVNS